MRLEPSINEQYRGLVEYYVKNNITLELAIEEATESLSMSVLLAETYGDQEGEWIWESDFHPALNTLLFKYDHATNDDDHTRAANEIISLLTNGVRDYFKSQIINDIKTEHFDSEHEVRKPGQGIENWREIAASNAGVSDKDFVGAGR